MTFLFCIIAAVTIASAILAMTLRNLVHCALALSATLAGLALLYLQLDAQFVGFAQILVYIGAVAILIVFAIFLTRGSEPSQQAIFSSAWAVSIAVALMVFGVLTRMILSSHALPISADSAHEAGVNHIGRQLMTIYALPLEVLGLLLTAALIGAVIIALHEKEPQ